MKSLYPLALTLICIPLGLAYHADSLTAKSTAAPQPAVIIPVNTPGCACGDTCECAGLRAQCQGLHSQCQQLEAQCQQLQSQLSQARATPAPTTRVVSATIVKADTSCPGGMCAVPQSTQAKRTIVQRPQRRLFGGRFR